MCESLISWDKEIIMKLTDQDDIKVRVFMNGPSKICGRQPLKNLKGIVCLSRPYLFKVLKGFLP